MRTHRKERHPMTDNTPALVPSRREFFAREYIMDQILGRRLKAIRESRQLTLGDLEALTGLPSDCLKELERGEIPIPVNRIRLIADAMDVTQLRLLQDLISPGS
jgi:hypothetical protein